MAAPDPDVGEYVYAATMDEVLTLTIKHIELARHAENEHVFHMQMHMAVKALTCALNIYRDRLAEQVQKEG